MAIIQTPTQLGILLVVNEDLIVSRFGSIAVTAGNAVGLQGDNVVNINGDVIATANTAVITAASIANSDITVGPDGYVSSQGFDAFNISPASTLSFTNQGVVSGFDALDVSPSDAGFTADIVNTGTMRGEDEAIELSLGNGSADIFNTGTIFGEENGIDIESGSSVSRTFIHNEGLIMGQLGAVTGSGSPHPITIVNTGEIVGFVFFGNGNDTYMGRYGTIDSAVSGGDGDDVLRGGEEANQFFGGNDNDRLQGYGGDDTLEGGAGFDTLFGNAGDDELDGGGRADRLIGGKGNDTMTGGGSSDTFVFRRVANGDDEITDFQNGSDVIDLSALGIQNFNALNNTFNALSNDTDAVVIDLAAAGGSGSVRVVGVQVVDMDASDFIF